MDKAMTGNYSEKMHLAGSNKSRCLKSTFLFMLVWFMGLFMGSFFKVSQWSWNQGTRYSISTKIVGNNSQALPKTLEYNNNGHQAVHDIKNPIGGAISVPSNKKNQTSIPSKKDPQPVIPSKSTKSEGKPATKIPESLPLTETISDRGNESSCPFPHLNPWDPKIMKYVKKFPPLNCAFGIPSIIDVVGNELRVNEEKRRKKVKSMDYCYYRTLVMKPGTDYSIIRGPWSKKFTTSIKLDDKAHNVQIDCFYKSGVVARSFIGIVRKQNAVEAKRIEDYKKHVIAHTPKETLSIILVGIDGTSKQNFDRSMPLTKNFITKNMNAIEFNKFNKVGLNTFPNVFALLTGKFIDEVKNWTFKDSFNNIDHLFSWNHYQKAGYRTAIVLDMVRITAFHYLKKGYTDAPFDFYPRPITIESEPEKKVYRKDSGNCMGDTPEVTVLHDYWLQLASIYNNTPATPYFAYSFLARLTHDDQNKASSGDVHYMNFFKELHRRRVLNNTLLIFFSDHGERFGNIRFTYNGLVEAKTPFLYFMFPPWFEKKYPALIKQLHVNTDRLMTMFDVHVTLEELLYFTGKSKPSSPLDRGISLFSEIPTNRTCEMAGIPVKFCACNKLSHKNITDEKLARSLVNSFVKQIIDRTKQYRSLCVELKHKETLYILPVDSEIPLSKSMKSLYHIILRTTPGDAVYEGSVAHHTNGKVSVYGDISRLNMYKGQAECINESLLRSFCYCAKKP